MGVFVCGWCVFPDGRCPEPQRGTGRGGTVLGKQETKEDLAYVFLSYKNKYWI